MKSIKEKELLVNFARSMGQAADPRLVEEVEKINNIKARVRESVSENLFKDLSDAFKLSNVIPAYVPEVDTEVIEIKETIEYPTPPSLDDLMLLLNEEPIIDEKIVTEPVAPALEEIAIIPQPIIAPTLADRTSDFISKSKDSFQQPDPLTVAPDMDAVTKKLRFLEQWIAKVSMAGPGGGAGDSVSLTNYTTVVTESTYSIKRKDYYVGVDHAGSVTITMPAFEVVPGRIIIIKDESGRASVNPITVDGTVDNDAGGFILQIDNGGIQMIYRNGWRII